MKKIAIFTAYYLPHLGGVERYTANLCKELKKMDYDVTIITCNYDNLKQEEQTDICKIYRMPVYSFLSGRCPIVKRNKEYKNIMKKIHNENFDSVIINTQLYVISLIGAKFAKKNNIPSCLIEHGTNHISFNNKLLDYIIAAYEHILTKMIKKNVKDFYGVSKGCNEWLKHFKIDSKGVFYNSIDSNDYEKYKNKQYPIKKEPTDVIITYASRIIKEKGILNLIDAFKILMKDYKNIKLVIAGEGPILDDLISQNKDNENIIFTKKLEHEEVMSLYNTTDIFVHPSMYPEGLPTSILEAGLMKCAVIATPRGGTVEVIEDKVNGLLVEENVTDLVDKIKMLLQNKELMDKYKEKINAKVKNQFSWNNTARTITNSIKYK